MKKKLISAVLCGMMAASMLAGCGDIETASEPASDSSDSAAVADDAASAASGVSAATYRE